MSQQPPYSNYDDPYYAANDPARYYTDPAAVYMVDQPRRPPAVILYWILCGLMIATGVIALGFGVFFLVADNAWLNSLDTQGEPMTASDQLAAGAIYTVIGFLGIIVYAVAFFLPRTTWAWVVHLVLQGLSILLCCCFAPLSIVTIIFWCLEPTRVWYGVTQVAAQPAYAQPYGTQPPMPSHDDAPPPPPQEPWRQ